MTSAKMFLNAAKFKDFELPPPCHNYTHTTHCFDNETNLLTTADGARERDEGALLLLLCGARLEEVLLQRVQAPRRELAALHGQKRFARLF